MTRITLPRLLALGLLVGCGAGIHGGSSGPAPDFTLRTCEGETFRLRDYVGDHVIVMSFWTTFCTSCRNELTQFQTLYEELEPSGLVIVAVSLDPPETVGEVRTMRDRMGLTFPVVLDTESTVAGQYNPRAATPFTIIIDGQGRRVYSHEGFVAGDLEEIDSTVRRLLAELEPAAAEGGGPSTSGGTP